MNVRYLVIACAAMALAAGLWLFLRDDRRAQAAQPQAALRADAPRAPDATPIDPHIVELEPRADVASTPPAVEAPVAPAIVAKPPTPDIQGTLSIERADGSKELVPQARLSLIAWAGESGRDVDVEVRDGHWATRYPDKLEGAVTRIQFTSLRIGDRSAIVREPKAAIDVPADKTIAVVAYFPESSILRVVDAASRAELVDVDLVKTSGYLGRDGAHPGPDSDRTALARHLSSPIDVGTLDLEGAPGVLELLVCAPGYAWTKITLDTSAGGERVVQLQPGGSLRLSLIDSSGSKGIQVRLRKSSEHSTPVVSVSASRRGDLVLDGLEPGAYTITAELGEWFRDPLALGHVDAQITAGQETRATLTIEPAPRAETATAGGVVIVPAEWKLERVTVTLQLLDTPLDGRKNRINVDARPTEPQADGQRVFEWSSRDLQVGRYELGIFKPPASIVIDVPRGGRSDFRFELPPPAELVVRVVDDATGDDVSVRMVLWNPKRPEGVHGGGLENAQYDAATRRYTIRAPQGEISLSVWGGEFAPKSDVVTLLPGRQEHMLRLSRATSVEIVLRDGDTALPFPNEWRATIETEDAKPVNVGSSESTNLRRYLVPASGRYRFKLPAINGYEPIADQLVDAVEGKTVRLDVPLTKLR